MPLQRNLPYTSPTDYGRDNNIPLGHASLNAQVIDATKFGPLDPELTKLASQCPRVGSLATKTSAKIH